MIQRGGDRHLRKTDGPKFEIVGEDRSRDGENRKALEELIAHRWRECVGYRAGR
jgi:hypothetical protein